MRHDIRWRKPEEWGKIKWTKNFDIAHILVQWKGREEEISTETVYFLGGLIVMDAPLHTFSAGEADTSKWKRFAIVRVFTKT